MDAVQIKEVLERTGSESTIYITVDTLKYLKKVEESRLRPRRWERFCV